MLGSIRDNILFGKSYCKEKYENVIYACALEQDMLQWPHADQTHVGEKGVGLSGGQKSRITLARAIYRYYASSFTALCTGIYALTV